MEKERREIDKFFLTEGCMGSRAFVSACACLSRLETYLRCPLQLLATLSIETGSLPEPRVHLFSQIGCPATFKEEPAFLVLGCQVNITIHIFFFMGVLGIKLMLAWQSLSFLSHHSSPSF